MVIGRVTTPELQNPPGIGVEIDGAATAVEYGSKHKAVPQGIASGQANQGLRGPVLGGCAVIVELDAGDGPGVEAELIGSGGGIVTASIFSTCAGWVSGICAVTERTCSSCPDAPWNWTAALRCSAGGTALAPGGEGCPPRGRPEMHSTCRSERGRTGPRGSPC